MALLHGHGELVLSDGLPEAEGRLVAVEEVAHLAALHLLGRHLAGTLNAGVPEVHVVRVGHRGAVVVRTDKRVALEVAAQRQVNLHDGKAVVHHRAGVVHPAHQTAHAAVVKNLVGDGALIDHIPQRVVARAPADDAAAGQVALAAVVGADDVHLNHAVVDEHAIALADKSAGSASAGRQRTLQPEVLNLGASRALAEQAARHAAVGVRVDEHLVSLRIERADVGHAVADEVVERRVVNVGQQAAAGIPFAAVHNLCKRVKVSAVLNQVNPVLFVQGMRTQHGKSHCHKCHRKLNLTLFHDNDTIIS